MIFALYLSLLVIKMLFFNKYKDHTVGNVLLVYEMSMHVFPTAPSPTVTHLINRAVLISSIGPTSLSTSSSSLKLNIRC